MTKCSVLIIEDEKNIQTFMGKILKRHEYRVLYANTGTQGLEVIRSQCPDIILLDLGLPDMNGDDLIREVRTWSSTPHYCDLCSHRGERKGTGSRSWS